MAHQFVMTPFSTLQKLTEMDVGLNQSRFQDSSCLPSHSPLLNWEWYGG